MPAFSGVEHSEQLGKDAHRVTPGRFNFNDVSPHLDQQLCGIGHRPPDPISRIRTPSKRVELTLTFPLRLVIGSNLPADGTRARLSARASFGQSKEVAGWPLRKAGSSPTATCT